MANVLSPLSSLACIHNVQMLQDHIIHYVGAKCHANKIKAIECVYPVMMGSIHMTCY